MRIRANTILRVCLDSLDVTSLRTFRASFYKLSAYKSLWCTAAKLAVCTCNDPVFMYTQTICLHILHACKYIHAAMEDRFRTKVRLTEDSSKKNTNTQTQGKEKTPSSSQHNLHFSNMLQSNWHGPLHVAWLQATALLQASNCCYFTSLRWFSL